MSKDVNKFKEDIRFKGNIAHIETIPGREASYRKVDNLNEKLVKYLDEKDINLYEHQAEALEKSKNGDNIIITTPTASGKTLAFNLPVLDALIEDDKSCALYIYPAKALAYDQLEVLRDFEKDLDIELNSNNYDGDTPKSKRYKIREESRVILTNPYQLHHILAWHHQWRRFYSNLKYIIIDEAHTYRGIFGSNVAFLIRRLKRIANFYGSNPQFILSSATLANPIELGEKLVGEEFSLIDNDTSPSGEKDFILYNPYMETPKKGEDSISIHQITEKIFLYLLLNDIQTLCFTSSRKIAELIAMWAKNDMYTLKRKYTERITSYRAGYLADERREIEKGLKSRDYLGVVSTNALELGINIGTLDAVLISGYPGSMVSTWQQAGRAGRGHQKSLVVLIAFENQLDQYFMNNPEEFFGKANENIVIDLNNDILKNNHIICAAKELPITIEEAEELFNADEEFLDNIAKNEDIFKNPAGIYMYPYDDSPSFDFSLDQISNEIFTIMCGREVVERIERSQMYREAHEGAILINKAQTYIVTNVNFKTHYIDVIKKSVRAHTLALKKTDIKITKKIKKERIGNFTVHFGELEVEEDYFKYKRMEFSKVIGTYNLDLPPLKFKTKGLWFTIPKGIKDKLEDLYEEKDVYMGGLHGVEHALIGLFPLHVTCDRFDIGGMSTNYHKDTQEATIFIYDAYEGGIGITEKAIEVFKNLTNSTRKLLKTCECEKGCPSCIYSPKCGNDNKPLHKKATEYILDYMWEEMSKPSYAEVSKEDFNYNNELKSIYKNEEEQFNIELPEEPFYEDIFDDSEDYNKYNDYNNHNTKINNKKSSKEKENNEEKDGVFIYDENKIKNKPKSKSLTKEEKIQEKYNEALEFYNNENYSYAKDLLLDIVNENKKHSDAWYLLGACLYKQEDIGGALGFLRRAIQYDKGHELANELYLEIQNNHNL
ncbi:MAG: DEAD/DEAH box helicase [Methanobacteriaceae archaeon]|nr:DEAD/DEAH box helicase [Methanobacteriaceae archaeon]